MSNQASTVCIILAAGSSSRMGKPKQLLKLQGVPMVARMCDLAQAAGFEEIVVVTGARRDAVAKALPGFVKVTHNPNWESGMGSSVYAGLSFALQCFRGLDMAGFILTDQPFLSADFLGALLQKLQNTEAPGIAAYYNSTLGVPAIFRSTLFSELLELKGRKGAKLILQKHQKVLLALPFPQGSFDLDFPEDWERFLGQYHG